MSTETDERFDVCERLCSSRRQVRSLSKTMGVSGLELLYRERFEGNKCVSRMLTKTKEMQQL